VLSQHAAASEQFEKVETWLIKNPDMRSGYRYHAAVRIWKDGQWQWLEQPPTVWTITIKQPKGVLLKRLDND